jgi:Rrf2 family protein
MSMLYFSGKSNLEVNSEAMAGSVNTHSVVIRRLLGKLKKAGLVASKRGPKGGFYLLKEPEDLNLWQIYRAVEGTRIINSSYREPNIDCPVGKNIQSVLEKIYIQVDLAVEEKLKSISLSQVLEGFPF